MKEATEKQRASIVSPNVSGVLPLTLVGVSRGTGPLLDGTPVVVQALSPACDGDSIVPSQEPPINQLNLHCL